MNPAHPDEAERLQRLAYLRDQIFDCDQDLVRIIGLRRRLVDEIGEIKTDLGLPLTDPQREAAVAQRAAELAKDGGIDEQLVGDLIRRVMAAARDLGSDGVPVAHGGGVDN